MGDRQTPVITTSDREAARAAVMIEPTCIQEEFIRVPSDLASFNERHADALESMLAAKRALEAGEAEIRVEYKRQSTEQRVTESYLDACVAQDPRYRVLRENADRTEVMKMRALGVVVAIQAKKEMLISLGAHIRKEMDNGPSINER